VHDYNAGIPPSGLFWTVELPPDAFWVSERQKYARLHLQNFPLIETFTFLGPHDTQAVLSMTIEWEALEKRVALGSGKEVPPTDPAAFRGRFAKARSTAHFSGRQLGFSFESDPGVSTDRGYAEIGRERNGIFLSPDEHG
jgi:hypothetical protein